MSMSQNRLMRRLPKPAGKQKGSTKSPKTNANGILEKQMLSHNNTNSGVKGTRFTNHHDTYRGRQSGKRKSEDMSLTPTPKKNKRKSKGTAPARTSMKIPNGWVNKANSTSSQRTQVYDKVVSKYEKLKDEGTAAKGSRRNLRAKWVRNQSIPRMVFDRRPNLEAATGRKRIYFSGREANPPPNLPLDSGTGSYSVHQYFIEECIINEVGGKGIVVTNEEGYIIALLPGRKYQHSIYSKHTTIPVFNQLLKGAPLGSTRGHAKEPVCSKPGGAFSCHGPKCNRNATGISDLSDRMTTEQRNELYRIIKQTEEVYRGNLDSDYIRLHTQMMKQMGVPRFKGTNKKGKAGETTLFPNIAFGKNVYLPVHIDHDNKLSITSVCDSEPEDHKNEILAYFCFPGKFHKLLFPNDLPVNSNQ